MNDRINLLKRYASTLKSWCINMSVASFAVGAYDGNLAGLFLGVLTIAIAIAIDYVITKDQS